MCHEYIVCLPHVSYHVLELYERLYICVRLCVHLYCHDLVCIFLFLYTNYTASWCLDSLTFSGNINKIPDIIMSALEFMEKTNK